MTPLNIYVTLSIPVDYENTVFFEKKTASKSNIAMISTFLDFRNIIEIKVRTTSCVYFWTGLDWRYKIQTWLDQAYT